MKLIDVYPDEGEKAGMQMLVRGDVVRGRYRDGFTRPKAFVPGSPETVPFRTTDIAHTFRRRTPDHGAGAEFVVPAHGAQSPAVHRPVALCGVGFRALRVTLFHQRDRASSLTVYKL